LAIGTNSLRISGLASPFIRIVPQIIKSHSGCQQDPDALKNSACHELQELADRFALLVGDLGSAKR
jgi:hypothetical protein